MIFRWSICMFTGPFGSETLADVDDVDTLFDLHENLVKLQLSIEEAGTQANSQELLGYHNEVQEAARRVKEHLRARPEVDVGEVDAHLNSLRDSL